MQPNTQKAPARGLSGEAHTQVKASADYTPIDFAQVAAAALSSAESVIAHWLPGGKQQGHEYTARNPTREDRRPSLSINTDTGKWLDRATDDRGGDLVALVAYLDGCSQLDAARKLQQFLGLPADRKAEPRPAPKRPANDAGEIITPVPDDAPPRPVAHPQHGSPSCVWTYRNAKARDLFHICRFDHADGSKDVLPLTLRKTDSGIKWRWKGHETPRPLYGLDRLAARPDADVVFCEGEKDADAAAILIPGKVAMTSPGGCKAADKADFEPLAGKSIAAWADADEPGDKFMEDVKRLALKAGALCVGRIDLDEVAKLRGAPLPKGWGAADALAEGIDGESLAVLAIEAIERAQAEQDEPAAPGSSLADVLTAGRAARAKADKLPRFEVIEEGHDKRPGLYFFGSTRDKETGDERPAPPVWISDPIYVTASTRDERGSEWGRILEFRDRDGRLKRRAMPCEMLAGTGEELRAMLLREGLNITSNPADRRRLLDYIAWSRPEITAKAVSRTGWHGTAFVLPDRAIGDTEAEPIHYQGSHAEGIKLGMGGTLEGWRENVATPCAGNSRLVVYVSAAFAANCLTMLGAEGGGLHVRGPSSAGKTSALLAAASVWGPPDYVRTWRATDNALEGIAAQHSDMPLCLDEIGELPAKVAGPCAYMLANGVGKSRADRSGAARTAARWRLLFLSTGEIGLSDLMAEAGARSRAGQEVRVIDIPADAGVGLGMFEKLPQGMTAGAFADRLRDAAAMHYGTAGPAFVSRLVQNHTEARDALRTARDAIAATLAPANAAGQVRRVAQRFALIAAAGELATEWGLTGWPEGEAATAATMCFRAWLGARGTAGAAEPAAMLRQVRRFLEAHGESRFAPWDAPDSRATINRAGFRRDAADGSGVEFYVMREAFKADICTGFDYRAVAQTLADAGALATDSDGSVTKPERLPGLGVTRCYRITSAIWGTGNA